MPDEPTPAEQKARTWLPIAKWFYRIAAAFIGGGASAVTSSITTGLLAPDKFNLGPQLRSMLLLVIITFFVNGLFALMFYLKQEPLPAWDGIDRRGDKP